MTLEQWAKKTKRPTIQSPSGAVCVCSTKSNNPDHHYELWHLSDYKVSTVSGLVVWVVPKTATERKKTDV